MTEEGKGSWKVKVRLKVGSLTLRWEEYFGSGKVEHMSTSQTSDKRILEVRRSGRELPRES